VKGGLKEMGLEEALKSYPWLGASQTEYAKLAVLRLVLDDPQGAEIRPDLPVSFATRTFRLRRVRTAFIPPPLYGSTAEQDADSHSHKEDPCICRV
jgi:hypothetical protein